MAVVYSNGHVHASTNSAACGYHIGDLGVEQASDPEPVDEPVDDVSCSVKMLTLALLALILVLFMLGPSPTPTEPSQPPTVSQVRSS